MSIDLWYSKNTKVWINLKILTSKCIIILIIYITNFYKMVSKKELKEYRATVQKVIDKYLPKEERFSVKDYSQEELYEITSMILEKDEKKRKILRENHEYRENLKIVQKLIEIEKRKEEYLTIFRTIDDLNSLAVSVEMQNKK